MGQLQEAGHMGIRYYAYAFDDALTERALANPQSILSADPLADAWGLEPGAAVSLATFEQVIPERDMLYLDKAWRHLQDLTGSTGEDGSARPAYRMFEGTVRMHRLGWDPWVRALAPDEMPGIARDLENVDESRLADFAGSGVDSVVETDYARQYLRRAREFASRLADEHRGMVYMIG